MAGNEFIADWYSGHCRDIRIVPTGVDVHAYRPLEGRHDTGTFTVGWMGTPGNFRYLRKIMPAIDRFLERFDFARFVVVSNRIPEWWRGDRPQYVFLPWGEDEEVGLLQSFDVGIMPLDDSPWTQGKCSFKMLQAMAVGIPVVVSPVGMNRTVLDLGDCGLSAVSVDEWCESLRVLVEDRARAAEMGETGRRIVTEHFDTAIVARLVGDVFAEIGES